MNIIKKVIFIFIFIFGFTMQAQNNDAEMEKILQERRAYNQAYDDAEGFRIQFFNGLSESQARSAQSKFAAVFPEIPTYLSYAQPEWKVQAGNYKVKLDAHRTLERIRREFPGALILKTKIKI